MSKSFVSIFQKSYYFLIIIFQISKNTKNLIAIKNYEKPANKYTIKIAIIIRIVSIFTITDESLSINYLFRFVVN